MKKLLSILICACFLIIVGKAEAFDYKKFPNIPDDAGFVKIYMKNKNTVWKVYDLDMDNKFDVAVGMIPKSAEPLMMMTPMGPIVKYIVDIEGIPVTYYWMDENGDGLPFLNDGSEEYDPNEVVYDLNGDGLNGNEVSINAKGV